MKTRTQPTRKPTRARPALPAHSVGTKKRAAKPATQPAPIPAPVAVSAPVEPPAAPHRIERTSDRPARAYGCADYGRAAFEAMVQSSAIVARGLEGIGQAWFGLTQASLHDGAATARAILGAKSAQQVLELQANYARATLDRLMVEGGKLSELSFSVANRAIEPIQSQVSAAVERLWRRAA